jgi:hypothetical protein
MKNPFKALRPFLPWCIAAVVCIVFVIVVIGIMKDAEQKGSIIQKQAAMNIHGSIPQDPLSAQLVSTLAMMPQGKKEIPLVAAVIENHEDARPLQKGLRKAEIVFEVIVEGDITRFLVLFRSDRLPAVIEPVRSARLAFISLLLPYKPLFLHIGGHPFAYEALKRYSAVVSHDGIRYDGETYERDPAGEPPHNLMMRRAPLLQVLEQKNIESSPLPLFTRTNRMPKGGEPANRIFVSYGSPIHDVTYIYKSIYGGLYTRSTAGRARQSQPASVVILETEIDGINQPGYVPWTQTFGEGRMLLFRKGKLIRGTWKRDEPYPFQFFDENGDWVSLSKGQVWVALVETLNRVRWE